MRRIIAVAVMATALAGCGSRGSTASQTTTTERATTTSPPTTTTDPEVARRRYSSELGATLDRFAENGDELVECAMDTIGPVVCDLRGPLAVMGAGILAETALVELEILAEDGPPPEELEDLVADLTTAAEQVKAASSAWDDAACTWPPSGDTCPSLYGDLNGAMRGLESVVERWQPYR